MLTQPLSSSSLTFLVLACVCLRLRRRPLPAIGTQVLRRNLPKFIVETCRPVSQDWLWPRAGVGNGNVVFVDQLAGVFDLPGSLQDDCRGRLLSEKQEVVWSRLFTLLWESC
jgi:hypothetical protein